MRVHTRSNAKTAEIAMISGFFLMTED